MEDDHQSPKKIVIVGDGYVGKTCILRSIEKKQFSDHAPNMYEVRVFEHRHKNAVFKMEFTDTAGQEEFDLTRRLFYTNAEVFLMCFDLSNAVSFDNLSEKWYLDLREFLPKPLILVGTKSDLKHAVSRQRIQEVVKQIGAVHYVECSAKSHKGIDELIDAIIKFGYKNKKSCTIQ